MSYGNTGGRQQQQQQQQQSFSFPLLSNDEILVCTNELQIPLEVSDLEKPNARSIRPVYEALCELCLDATKDELSHAAPVPMLDALEFPELHDDSIPQLTFFRSVSKLLDASGVHDTRLLDLTKPDPQRLKRNLSAIINFAKFREERRTKFLDMLEHREQLFEDHARAEAQVAKAQATIKKLDQAAEREKPTIEALREECKRFETDINECNKEQAILKYEAGEQKTTNNQLRDEAASVQFQTMNVRQETEKLQGNIVQSPARLKGELEQQQTHLEAEKEENRRMEKTLRDERARCDAISRAKKEVSRVVSLVEQVEGHMLKCKTTTKEAKSQAASLHTHENAMRELERRCSEHETQLQYATDKLDRLLTQKKIKSQAAEQALKSAREELEALRAEHGDTENQATNAEYEVRELRAKLESQRNAHQVAVAERVESFKQLQRQVNNYHSRLGLAVAQAGVSPSSSMNGGEEEVNNLQGKEEEEEEESIEQRMQRMSVVGGGGALTSNAASFAGGRDKNNEQDDGDLSVAMSRVGIHDSQKPPSSSFSMVA